MRAIPARSGTARHNYDLRGARDSPDRLNSGPLRLPQRFGNPVFQTSRGARQSSLGCRALRAHDNAAAAADGDRDLAALVNTAARAVDVSQIDGGARDTIAETSSANRRRLEIKSRKLSVMSIERVRIESSIVTSNS